MSRQSTDQLYIELGYYNPEEYYVYQAEAAASTNSAFAVTATVGVIKSSQVTLAVSIVQTVSITHIEGVDLFAFANAALAAEVSRLREYNCGLSGIFDIAVDFIKLISFSSTADIVAAQSVVNTRGREFEFSNQAAFSFATDAIRIREFDSQQTAAVTFVCQAERISVQEGAAALSSNISISADISVTRSINSQLLNSSALSVIISHLEGTDIILTNFATVTVTIDLTRDFSSNQNSNFNLLANIDKILESTSNLTTAVAVTTDSIRLRSFDSSQTGISTLTATLSNILGADLILSNFASILAIAVKTAEISASTSVNATISALGGKKQSFSVLMTADTEIYVSRNLNGRPREFTQTGTLSFDTSIKKFGTGSYYYDGQGLSDTNYISYASTPDWTKIKTIDFWWYHQTQVGSYLDQNDILTWYQDSNNFKAIKINPNEIGLRQIVIDQVINGVSSEKYRKTTTASSYPNGNWYHFRILDDGSSLTVWVNGARITKDSGTYSAGLALNAPLRLGRFSSKPVRFDELLITQEILTSSSTTSFTPPSRWTPTDQSNILLLSHFDESYIDDVTILHLANAVLNSNINQTTIAEKTSIAVVSLSSTAIFNLNATRILENNAVLNSSIDQTTDNDRIREFHSQQSVTASSLISIGNIKQFASTNNSLFTPAITAEGRLVGVALINSSLVMSVTAEKTANAQCLLDVAVQQSIQASVIADTDVDLNANVGQLILNDRLRDFSSNQSSIFNQQSTEQFVVGFDCALTVTASVTATIDKLKLISADLTAIFTAPEIKFHIKHNSIAALEQSFFGLEAVTDRIREFDLDLNSAVIQSTVSVKITEIQNNLSVVIALACSPVKTVTVSTTQTSIASQLTAAFYNATGTVLLESLSTLTAIPGRIIEYVPNTNTGVQTHSNKNALVTMDFQRGAFDQIEISDQGFTLSIWVKRDSIVLDQFQPIISNEQDDGAFTFYGNHVMIRQNTDADEPNPTWTNVSTDTDWHHYLFYTTRKGLSQSPSNTYFRLWIDGEYKGEQNYLGPQLLTISPFNSGDDLQFGLATLANLSAPYNTSTRRLTGAFAQLWLGEIPSEQRLNYSPVVEYFYDGGYVDLSSTGQGFNNRLPEPLVYNRLDQPWDDVQFTAGYSESDKLPGTAIPVPSFSAYAGLSTVVNISVESIGQLNTVVQLTAEANYTIIQSSALSVIFSQSTNEDYRIGAVVNLSLSTNILITAAKITDTVSSNPVTADLSVLPGFFQQAEAQLSDQFDFVCSFDAVPPTRGEAALSSQFTMVTDAGSFTDAIIINTAFGTLVCDATVIPPVRVTANLTTTATMSVTIGSIEQFAVLTASLGTMTVSPVKTARTDSILAVSAAQIITPTKFTGIILTLYAFDSVLVAGDVINLDPYLTLWIAPESRTYEIPAETRIITILQETRVNIIEGYSQ